MLGKIARTTSPCFMLPPRTASSNASGMDAALVFPYSARLLITRSCMCTGKVVHVIAQLQEH